MRKKLTLLPVLFILALILTSGCIQQITGKLMGGDKIEQCNKLEKTLKEREDIQCKCQPTDFVPKELRNRTGIEGRCYCNCVTAQGNKSTVSIVRTQEGRYIVSRLTS